MASVTQISSGITSAVTTCELLIPLLAYIEIEAAVLVTFNEFTIHTSINSYNFIKSLHTSIIISLIITMPKRSKRKGGFQKGHSYAKPYSVNKVPKSDVRTDVRRFLVEDYELIVKSEGDVLKTPDSKGKDGNALILRPRVSVSNNSDCNVEDNIYGHYILSLAQIEGLINSSITEHSLQQPECCLRIKFCDKLKKGTSAKFAVQCMNCGYKSMSNETHILNEQDMSSRREKIKEVLQLRGHSSSSEVITGQFDVAYSGTHLTSSYREGFGASQATGAFMEDLTGKHQILALYSQSKLCVTGAWLRNQGFDVKCPGHENCTANISATDNISEYEIGCAVGSQLLSNLLLVDSMCSDGDGSGADGVESKMKDFKPLWEVFRHHDTSHLGKSQAKAGQNATFSALMFSQVKGTASKLRAKKAFGKDLAQRCSLAYSSLHSKFKGDIKKISSVVYKTVDSIIDCYSGDHSLCQNSTVSFGCKSKAKTWLTKSSNLSPYKIKSFPMTAADKILLREIINIRLGHSAILRTPRNRTTQIAEAANQSYRSFCPRGKRFPRTLKGKTGAWALRHNNGKGKSLQLALMKKKCCPEAGTDAGKTLQRQAGQAVYKRQYNRRKEVKRRKFSSKCRRTVEYHKTAIKREKDKHLHVYKKNKLGPQMVQDKLQWSDHDKYTSSQLPGSTILRRKRLRKDLQ